MLSRGETCAEYLGGHIFTWLHRVTFGVERVRELGQDVLCSVKKIAKVKTPLPWQLVKHEWVKVGQMLSDLKL